MLISALILQRLRTQNINDCIEKALCAVGHHIVLQSEQRKAIADLLLGKDVIAISAPTGCGKSMIFIVNVLAKRELMKMSEINVHHGCSVLVVSERG